MTAQRQLPEPARLARTIPDVGTSPPKHNIACYKMLLLCCNNKHDNNDNTNNDNMLARPIPDVVVSPVYIHVYIYIYI